MNYYVMTLFPEMVEHGMKTSITGRAIDRGLLSLDCINIRDFAEEKRKSRVDDYPYGGGAGMVMQAEPVYRCYEECLRRIRERDLRDLMRQEVTESGEAYETEADLPIQPEIEKRVRMIYLTPQGKVFDQKMAQELAKEEELIFLCGHYEGIDERVLEEIVTDPVSIGDYVLTGGELPAMVMMDCISRMVPGVLTNEESGLSESFSDGLLEYPQYTRPALWHDREVPPILVSGDHGKVDLWRRQQSLLRTLSCRPELLETAPLSPADLRFLRETLANQE